MLLSHHAMVVWVRNEHYGMFVGNWCELYGAQETFESRFMWVAELEMLPNYKMLHVKLFLHTKYAASQIASVWSMPTAQQAPFCILEAN